MYKHVMYIANQLYCRFQDDEVTALGAQLTYYLILSFFPFLIFILTLSSYTPLASAEALTELLRLLPESSYHFIADIIDETIAASNRTLLSVGMAAAVWTSSSGMMAVIKGINKAYDTEENRAFWKVRLLSIVYTLVFGVLILLTFALLVFGEMIGKLWFSWVQLPGYFETAWSIGKVAIPVSMMLLVFILLYMQAPNYRVGLRNAWPGAIFASVGWIAASLLFSFYVGHFGNFARTYGSIGGVIVLLIWIYISSIIVIMGGEVNAALQFYKEHRTKAECKKYGFRWPFFRFGKRKKAT